MTSSALLNVNKKFADLVYLGAEFFGSRGIFYLFIVLFFEGEVLIVVSVTIPEWTAFLEVILLFFLVKKKSWVLLALSLSLMPDVLFFS